MNKRISYTKRPQQRERQLQAAVVRWWRLQYPKHTLLLFMIPNGVKLAGDQRMRARHGAQMKREGMVPGAADLFLSIASGDYNGLYLEAKTEQGRQSKSQKEFERAVVEQGYGYVLFRSLDDFMRIVKQYLENGDY